MEQDSGKFAGISVEHGLESAQMRWVQKVKVNARLYVRAKVT